MGPTTRLLAILGLAFALTAPVANAQTPESDGAWSVSDTEEIDLSSRGQNATLSPDGETIAFIRDRENFCILNIESGDEACTEEDGLAVDPGSIAWAPDGSAVAFSLNAALYLIDSDIYVMDVDSGEVAGLTDDGEARRLEISGDDDIEIDTYPAWSPDGDQIVFARTNLATGAGTSLMTIPADGGEPDVVEGTEVEIPFAINAQIFWMESEALYYSIWAGDQNDPDNGIWRWQDGETEQILNGAAGEDYPYPELTSILPDESFALGSSAELLSQTSFDPDLSRVFALDLTTGEVAPADDALLDDPETQQVIYTPRLSADGNGLIYGILDPGAGTISIRIVNIIDGEPQEILKISAEDVDDAPLSLGLSWASNDTVLVPTPSNDGAVLVTLEPGLEATPVIECGCSIEEITPTPVAPCSCTPPEDASPPA